MTSSTSRVGGPVAVESSNRLFSISKPLPPPPSRNGSIKVNDVKAVPVTQRTDQEEKKLTDLLIRHVELHQELAGYQQELAGYQQERQKLATEKKAIHDNAEMQRQLIRQEALAEKKEANRQGVVDMLGLIFDTTLPAFQSLSLQDSEKFEFNAEKEIFVVTEKAMNDVILKIMRENKALKSVDLSVCTQLPEKTVIKLLEQAPKIGLKQLILPRELTHQEKQAEIAAKKAINDLKISVAS